jgi:hypothetical protein
MRSGLPAVLVASVTLVTGGMTLAAAPAVASSTPAAIRAPAAPDLRAGAVRGSEGRDPAGRALAAIAAGRLRAAGPPARQAIVTGVVRAATGLPLSGACVTAAGRLGAAAARAGANGQFRLAGLRPGWYTLEFRDCVRPGRYRPQWSGAAPVASLSRPVQVRPGKVTAIAPVRLRPASQAAMFARPPAAQLARAAGEAAARPGGIAGRLTGPHGQAVTRTCAEIFGAGFSIGVPVARTGSYTTGRSLPPGRYKVQFAALDCGANPGNWAPRWYKNKTTQKTANVVRVAAGKVTRNISGRLRHGSVITGAVTSRAGRKLTGRCVILVSPKDAGLAFASYRHGQYSIRGIPAGRYRVLFAPGCGGQSRYLDQWWRDTGSFRHATVIRVRAHATIRGISARLRTGGMITGTVRLGSAAGRGLRGICVDAQNQAGLFEVATRQGGRYRVEGLPAGRYSVSFYPGCGNDGNYLESDYPGRVPVTAGKTATGVDGVLRPGGLIAGKVTAPDGQPIVNMAVLAFDQNGDFGFACTSPAGTYRLRQLPTGRYTIEFANECGAKGSWAPQFYPDKTDPDAAVPVRVGPGQHVTGINAAMHPGAVISGTITSRAGRPVSRICASAESVSEAFTGIEIGGEGDAGIKTGRHGGYRIANLPAGRYAVQFTECGAPAYASRWFSGRPGVPIGDVVDVGAGAVVRGVGAVLAPGGAIAGSIRSQAGQPVGSACADATNLRTGALATTIEASSGSRYELTGLPAGQYRIFFHTCEVGGPYAAQWYNRQPSPRTASPVRVTGGDRTSPVDAVLARGGTITGRLTSKATGRPLRDFCVEASSRSGTFFGIGITNRSGRYAITGLNTASYLVQAINCDLSPTTAAQSQLAAAVHVTAPHTVTEISAALAPGGTVSGQVLAGTPAAGQSSVCVEADPAQPGLLSGFTLTGHGGRYQLTNLQPGRYKIHFLTRGDCDLSRDGLIPQWYKGADTKTAAAVVTVRAARDTGGISATLQGDGGISGQVTAAATGAPLTGACVRAVPLAAGTAASFTATAGGHYTLTGLVPGRYKVEFRSGCGISGFATQWWHDAASAAAATAITVKPGTVTAGISGALKH